jgi:hypothetical protein
MVGILAGLAGLLISTGGHAGNGWAPAGYMSGPRLWHTATMLGDGDVVLLGSTIHSISAEIYNPRLRTFTPIAAVPAIPGLHSSTLLRGSRTILVLLSDSEPQLYDLAADTWRSTGSPTIRRFGFSTTELQSGQVLIAGGSEGPLHSQMLRSAELFDLVSASFKATGSLLQARRWHASVLLKSGSVLIAGGGDAMGMPLDTAELFDPTSGTFRAAARMVTARGVSNTPIPALLLPSGEVMIPAHGGFGSQIYDPETNAWRMAAAMPEPRDNFAAVVLGSGKVLVAGGSSPGGPATTSTQIYDPSTDTWAPAGAMAVAREVPAAVLLASGHVLVTGGSQRESLAEVYTPDGVAPFGVGEDEGGCQVAHLGGKTRHGLTGLLPVALALLFLRRKRHRSTR